MTAFSRSTLSIYSETHPASAISAVLGLEPSALHERGDRRIGRNGREYGPYATSSWHYDLNNPVDVDDATGTCSLRALVEAISDRADALSSLRPNYTTAIRWSADVRSDQGNFEIPGDLMIALGLLGCDLYGTVYPDESPADEV